MNNSTIPWVEKYRPDKAEDYVFVNENQKKTVEHWISVQSIPHLLLSGDPGTGKTTLAKVLIHELGVEDFDVLEINASRENGVDVIRDKSQYAKYILEHPQKVVEENKVEENK